MSKFCAVLLMVTTITSLLTTVNGRCFYKPLTIVTKGKWVMKKCVHESWVYLIGSEFKTVNCIECVCNESGFACCGYGINSSTIHVPSGYKIVPDGCDYTIEKDDSANIENETQSALEAT